MPFQRIIFKLIDCLDEPVADEVLYFELVQGLYGATSSAKAMLGAAIAAMVVLTTANALSGDAFYGILFLAFLIVGVGRSASAWFYHRAKHDPRDLTATRYWELGAMLGAWTFAGLVGLAGAYTVVLYPNTEVEVLISCCVMGYIAGTSSRNASRPVITVGQISFTCVPFMLALLWRADVVHTILAIFIAILYVGTIVVCRSVFDQIVSRHKAFRRIETIAHRDVLTGLWNRAAFIELLEQRLAATGEMGGSIAVIAIDLDRFKDINDTLGHPVGDAVLKQVADRVRSTLEPGDEISRIGGDEFLVMLSGHRALDMEDVANCILMRFCEPFVVGMTSSVCGASIGCAIAPQDGATLDVILRNADLALYEAKKRGRNQAVSYSPALSDQYETRIALEHDLQFALSRDELYLDYQPIVDPRSGRVICCEALLRWKHPVLGLIPPNAFIPVAEATGLIVPIGDWVLRSACAEATKWSSDIKVAVNLSPIQFRRGHEILETVLTALADTGLPPGRLDLEITESLLIDDGAATLKVLEELRRQGVGITLDDFGTGFASLAYLNDFPFSKIKIDRKFVQTVEYSPRTFAIFKSIAQVTRELRIECVAEGVETNVQLERVMAFGINAIQGYLFSKPLSTDELRLSIKKPIRPVLPAPRSVSVETRLAS
jgi:diguanylate cyclase (GGDEF)-like protein